MHYKKLTHNEITKVGFPIQSLGKVTNVLKQKKMNYVVYEHEQIIERKKFNQNMYYFYQKVSSTDDEKNKIINQITVLLSQCSNIQALYSILEDIKCKIDY